MRFNVGDRVRDLRYLQLALGTIKTVGNVIIEVDWDDGTVGYHEYTTIDRAFLHIEAKPHEE